MFMVLSTQFLIFFLFFTINVISFARGRRETNHNHRSFIDSLFSAPLVCAASGTNQGGLVLNLPPGHIPLKLCGVGLP